MTAVAQAPASTAASQSAEVARARVAVLVATHQVDVVLPTRFGIESFIDDLLVVLAAAIDDETVDFTAAAGQWSLARPGEAAMPRWRTLADHDVSDGALLLLTTVESSEMFSPLVEDITDALALVNDREFGEFDAEAAAVAGLSAFGAVACVVAALLAWIWTSTGSALWSALPALALGAACWTAAAILRRHDAPRIALTTALSALPLIFTGAATLVPPPYGHPGPFAAANIAAGATVTAIVAAGLLGTARSGRAALLAVTAVGLLTGVGAIAMVVADISGRQVAGAWVLAGLVLLTGAPRIAVLLARIRPPDLPDPGREIAANTLTDVFDAASAGADEPADDGASVGGPRGVGTIEARARLAVTGLRGLIAAAVLLLSAATVGAVVAAPGGVREIVLAAAVTGALVLRARWHPDRVQACLLIGGGVVTALGAGVVLVDAYAAPVARLVVVAVLVAGAIAGALAGLRLPGVRLSPIVRRVIDLIEYLLILVVPLLSCWIMGIYTALRGL
ncbi:type VII secretion integral membrane protein EccD [Nocardia tengchongensis]|uniref:type VII secretion integral membrane protein EccD n=1 Tax=Nocardia tengchongensis TaxID=2055889 RepID=UPI0036AC7456